MGSGGYAAVSAKATLAAQRAAAAQKRVVEKAAFDTNFLGFEPNTDLPLPPINEAGCDAFFNFTDGFENAALDTSLWECASHDVPAWGTVAVDALFNFPTGLPGSLPGSPIKGGASGPISPLGSPFRAPGSPATHFEPAAPAAAPAEPLAASATALAPAAIPTVTSVAAVPTVDILTSYASTGEPEVLVVLTPRAPKRAAEAAAAEDARLVRQRSTDDAARDDSDGSDASAASLERDDIMPALIAAPLTSQAQAEAALEGMPTSQQTAAGEVVTLSPTLWLDACTNAHPPFRIHVNAGLHSMRAPGVEAPITLFGAIHPRIVTTGQPHRRLGRARRQADAPAPPTTRATRAHGADRAASGDMGAGPRRDRAAAAAADRDGCTLQEVWLLKRSIERGAAPAVLEAHRCCGPFDGTTFSVDMGGAVGHGAFAIDVAARVADGQSSFWVKAENRAVQDIAAA